MGRPISSLVIAELYEAGDASFLWSMFNKAKDLKPYLSSIERWKKDARPWARKLKLDFVRHPSLTAEHRLIFKRLFKQASADQDHELMAAYLHVLDTWIRRRRVKRYAYKPGAFEVTEILRDPPRNKVSIFSKPTTHYLRRRAWRYFRKLGFKDAQNYMNSVAIALVGYTDDDVRVGENLLDCWGLMHVCFGKSAVVTFNQRHTNVRPDALFSTLTAAPMFERHWAMSTSGPVLIDILLKAKCRPIRIWAIQLLKRHHSTSLVAMKTEQLLQLLDHSDGDVAAFAAELLANATTIAGLPMATWMQLLATRSPTVVALISEAFRKHVSFDRLSLAQAVELATRPAVPVAKLGMEVLAVRPIRSAPDRAEIAKLARAECVAMGGEISAFAIPKINATGNYDIDQVIPFFDSALLTMRTGGFGSLDSQSPAGTDPAFWARLFESPYDDVRTQLVKRLSVRGSLPGASIDSLTWLWQSVLLNIHRGGRSKLTALRQISDQIMREPASATGLLPILVIAIRSVRSPEARHGLAAIVSAVEHVPSLETQLAAQLPELRLHANGGVR